MYNELMYKTSSKELVQKVKEEPKIFAEVRIWFYCTKPLAQFDRSIMQVSATRSPPGRQTRWNIISRSSQRPIPPNLLSSLTLGVATPRSQRSLCRRGFPFCPLIWFRTGNTSWKQTYAVRSPCQGNRREAVGLWTLWSARSAS